MALRIPLHSNRSALATAGRCQQAGGGRQQRTRGPPTHHAMRRRSVLAPPTASILRTVQQATVVRRVKALVPDMVKRRVRVAEATLGCCALAGLVLGLTTEVATGLTLRQQLSADAGPIATVCLLVVAAQLQRLRGGLDESDEALLFRLGRASMLTMTMLLLSGL